MWPHTERAEGRGTTLDVEIVERGGGDHTGLVTRHRESHIDGRSQPQLESPHPLQSSMLTVGTAVLLVAPPHSRRV